MAEDLVELEQKKDALERELFIAKGNITALSVVIGLMADKYPDNLASQYIRECVNFKLTGDLMKKEARALQHLAQIMDGDTYEQLVSLCAGYTEVNLGPEFEMPDTSAAAKTEETMICTGEAKPTEATFSAYAAKVAGGAAETTGAADAK